MVKSDIDTGDVHYSRNFFTKREIYRNINELYLTRYVIFRCRWFGVYIHKFHSSDRPYPHCHPWNFLVIPIIRGYREHMVDGTVVDRKPFQIKFRTAREFHYVELKDNKPAWSLFIHFRRQRLWGFLADRTWVDHITYINNIEKSNSKS